MSEKKKSILDSNLFDCFKPSTSHEFEDSFRYKQVPDIEKRYTHNKEKHHKDKPKGSTHLSSNFKCPHCGYCTPCTIQKIIILNPCSCMEEKFKHEDFGTSNRFPYYEVNDD